MIGGVRGPTTRQAWQAAVRGRRRVDFARGGDVRGVAEWCARATGLPSGPRLRNRTERWFDIDHSGTRLRRRASVQRLAGSATDSPVAWWPTFLDSACRLPGSSTASTRRERAARSSCTGRRQRRSRNRACSGCSWMDRVRAERRSGGARPASPRRLSALLPPRCSAQGTPEPTAAAKLGPVAIRQAAAETVAQSSLRRRTTIGLEPPHGACSRPPR